MPKSVSAFIAKDGTLFASRDDAEKHEIMAALVEKFGVDAAITLSVIVDERNWFTNLFTEVKKEYPGAIEPTPQPTLKDTLVPSEPA